MTIAVRPSEIDTAVIANDVPLVVLGASGFVGTHLVAHAAAEWHGPITVVTRGMVEPPSPRVSICRQSVLDAADLAADLPRDAVVVNLIYAADADEAENLALVDAIADVCDRTHAVALVHVSTATVVGASSSAVITEETPCLPVTAYERAKLAIESRLTERLTGACRLTILRPTAVFGSGGRNLRKLAMDLRMQSAAGNYLRACLFGRRPMHLVPVETLVAAIMFYALPNASVPPSLCIVSDDDDPQNNFRDVEHAIREAMGKAPPRWPIVPLPRAALSAGQRLVGRHSLAPYSRFSARRLNEAGFVRPIAFGDALASYARTLSAP